MSGRHRKPGQSNYHVAKIAVTGAVLGGGGFVLAGHAAAATDSEWDRVAGCESGGNWSINTGNGYQGGLQFAPSTWSSHGGKEFASSAHHASKEEQILVAERVLATQGRGAWPTCGTVLSGPTQRTLSPPAEEIPPPAEELPPPAEELPPPPEDLPPPAEEIPPPAEELPPPPEDLPPPAEELPPVAEELPPPAEELPPPPADLPPPADAPPADAPPVMEAFTAVPPQDLPDPGALPDLQAVPEPVFDVANRLMSGESPAGLTLPQDLPIGDQIPLDPAGHPDAGYVQELWLAIQDQGITSNDALEALANPAPLPA